MGKVRQHKGKSYYSLGYVADKGKAKICSVAHCLLIYADRLGGYEFLCSGEGAYDTGVRSEGLQMLCC